MHPDAGHLLGGIKLVPLPVKIVECKCVALPCSYPVEFHFSPALNSFAVQNISNVSCEQFSSPVFLGLVIAVCCFVGECFFLFISVKAVKMRPQYDK